MSKLKSIHPGWLAALLLILAVNSCTKTGKRKLPDVSHIQVEVNLSRFETDLFSIGSGDADLSGSVSWLRARHPDFTRCFSENILVPPTPVDSTAKLMAALGRLLQFRGLQAAFDSTMRRYSDLAWLEKDLTQAFRYYGYYYPDAIVPSVVTFVSEYQYAVVICSDSTFGIGLDMFLGRDFPFYSTFEIGIPSYRLPKMEREYILPNLFRAIAHNMYGQWADGQTLLDQMVHNGKVMAFIDAMIPKAPDWVKVDFTKEQLKWCEDNESEVWAFFKGEELLYRASKMEFIKFIADAPGTPGMPQEAPGNIGSWLGWRIVQKYMEKTGASLPEVMAEANAQQILERSGYKPRR